MRFSSLGSGSSGNATLIQTEHTLIMLDCGFSCKEAINRLQRMAVEPSMIDAIVVTHEHNDHLGGVGAFSRKFNIPVWMNYGTSRARDIGSIYRLNIFNSQQSFTIKDLQLNPFVVPHDSREAVQFVFSNKGKKLAIVTDLGHVSSFILTFLKNLDALVIEANHDLDMLWSGSYRHSLKQRVSGDYGHLSNHQAAELVKSLDISSLQFLIAAHLSNENNSVEKLTTTFTQVLNSLPEQFEIANQTGGFGWKNIV